MAERIVLATCAAWPELSAGDQRLAEALQSRGYTADVAPWNGPFGPFVPRRRHRPARHLRPPYRADQYGDWLGRLDPARTFNPPALVRWNLEKTHLLDLASRGATLPRSAVVPADVPAVVDAIRRFGVWDTVLKPTIGASGFGVERVRPGD